jgi:hypothetical protein
LKPIYQSKTLWFNIASAAALILALPEFTAVIPAEYVKFAVLVQAGVNIILRIWTTQGVTFGGN